MHKCLGSLLVVLFLTLVMPAQAAIETYQFAAPELADRFAELTTELRCPKCQNQNLADSDSIISKDLRRQVKQMVDAGQSDDEIRAFMVQRYGDFILYDPPFNTQTLVLWLAPGVLVLLGLGVVIFMRRGKAAAPAALSDQERAELDALIKRQEEASE
ncbi:MAG: cytochrome c-type biogenesis protein CcmH [Gammaproteobacteria bacterium]|jgi:cytochrome c-type biogenesis protein CcmH|nr:cytochrome c-type biogenesis protein CcmH [Gammaproteobacteria bacterium]